MNLVLEKDWMYREDPNKVCKDAYVTEKRSNVSQHTDIEETFNYDLVHRKGIKRSEPAIV